MKPNILLIMTDQQRWDSLGCYGASWVQTPNLDRLASTGVRFDTCYSDNPVCTPSRASLLTGKALPGHGVYQLHDVLPPDEVLISKRLQDRGYQTALFGKLHVSGRIEEEKQRHDNDGFDVYEWCIEAPVGMDSPFNGYSEWLRRKDPGFHQRLKREGRGVLHVPRELHLTHWAAERTIDYIRNADRDRPFFCKMSVFDPHNPYEQYPREMDQLVREEAIPEPIPAGDQAVPEAIQRERDHNYFGTVTTLGTAGIQAMRRGYHAMIGFIDQEVGRVLRELDEHRLAEDTLVIFCSDHGDMLGDHGLLVKGAYFYDPCVRVPLLMRWPRGGIVGGREISDPVQLRDLAATLLAAAGAESDEVCRELPDSLDLLPLAGNVDNACGRDVVVTLYRNSGICDSGRAWDPPINASMIRDRRYKLSLFHHSSGAGGDPKGQFFDMIDDPDERRDLWDDPEFSGERLRMTGLLVDWFREHERLGAPTVRTAAPTPEQQLVNKVRS